MADFDPPRDQRRWAVPLAVSGGWLGLCLLCWTLSVERARPLELLATRWDLGLPAPGELRLASMSWVTQGPAELRPTGPASSAAPRGPSPKRQPEADNPRPLAPVASVEALPPARAPLARLPSPNPPALLDHRGGLRPWHDRMNERLVAPEPRGEALAGSRHSPTTSRAQTPLAALAGLEASQLPRTGRSAVVRSRAATSGSGSVLPSLEPASVAHSGAVSSAAQRSSDADSRPDQGEGVRKPAAASERPVTVHMGRGCEAAFERAQQDIDLRQGTQAPADISRESYANALRAADFSSCQLQEQMDVQICVAVQHGRAQGVSVTTHPGDGRLARCVARRIQALRLPSAPNMDLVRTEFYVR